MEKGKENGKPKKKWITPRTPPSLSKQLKTVQLQQKQRHNNVRLRQVKLTTLLPKITNEPEKPQPPPSNKLDRDKVPHLKSNNPDDLVLKIVRRKEEKRLEGTDENHDNEKRVESQESEKDVSEGLLNDCSPVVNLSSSSKNIPPLTSPDAWRTANPATQEAFEKGWIGMVKPTSPVRKGSNYNLSDTKTKTLSPNNTLDFIKDFDKVPVSKIADDLAFKTVRRKEDRARLQGTDCDECRNYYKAVGSQMSERDLQRLLNNCSRHRVNRPSSSKNIPILTPPDAWRTSNPGTQEAYEKGWIGIGEASPPVRRRRNYDYDDE